MDYLTILISSIAIILSALSLYLQLLRKGKLIFSDPSYIVAHRYNKNDVIILPISLTNTGVFTRVVQLKLIANGQKAFHHQVDFDAIILPGPNSAFSADGSMMVQVPLTIAPNSGNTKIAGFTQLDYIQNSGIEPNFDLWYKEGKDWNFAFGIKWKDFHKLIGSYGPGLILSTTQIEVYHNNPSYQGLFWKHRELGYRAESRK